MDKNQDSTIKNMIQTGSKSE